MGFRKAYSVIGALLLFELMAQFYFVAGGIFTIAAKADPEASAKVVKEAVNSSEPFFGLHSLNGVFVIPITILVLIGLSFAARYPWRTTGYTAALAGLWVIQFLLAAVGFAGVAVVAGLHGINALILVGTTIFVVYRSWAFRRQPAAIPPAQPDLTGASTRT
ncbi:MAG: hypothetical protein M3R21_02930 [Candidatus Dormibacteraeota bacterium]|nr:hypothetical protein [Candidatus Dormibacteraeota bacterium]